MAIVIIDQEKHLLVSEDPGVGVEVGGEVVEAEGDLDIRIGKMTIVPQIDILSTLIVSRQSEGQGGGELDQEAEVEAVEGAVGVVAGTTEGVTGVLPEVRLMAEGDQVVGEGEKVELRGDEGAEAVGKEVGVVGVEVIGVTDVEGVELFQLIKVKEL